MSPRGFYQRESMQPFYSTEEYIQSDQGKSEYATMDRLEKKAEALFMYPAKIARRVWIWILFRLGHLKDLLK
jgi:hypothetical protein